MKQLITNLTMAFVACALVAGCKGKQTQADQSIDSAANGGAVNSAPLSFDVTGSDSGKIDGLRSINFGYDKSTIDADAKKILAGNVEWLKSHSGSKLQIEGHCDQRGTIEYNVALGERRANAVKAYMVSLGAKADRLSTISYGKEKPLDNGDSEAAMAKNRRANFVPVQ